MLLILGKMMIDKINQFVTLALSITSIFLPSSYVNPIENYPISEEKNHGIYICVVNFLPHQLAVQPVTNIPQKNRIEIVQTRDNIYDRHPLIIDKRGSERHR